MGWALCSSYNSWTIDADAAVIGRASPNGPEIGLNDPRVSRSHALLEMIEGVPVLRDMGSRNGTFLNGCRVAESVRLSDGDVVRVGDTRLQVTRAPGLSDTSRSVFDDFDEHETDTHAIPYEVLARVATERAQKGAAEAGVALLYTVGRSVAGLRDPADIVDAVVGAAADLLKAERVAIYEPCGSALAPLLGKEAGVAQRRVPSGAAQTLIWRALRLREAVLYDSARTAATSRSAQLLLLRSAVAVPLCAGDETIGVLYADTRCDERPLDAMSLRLMGALALQAAASLKAARQHAEVLAAREELDEAYARMRQWNGELERRVAERTQHVERQKEEIEMLLDERNDLLRMVAHDLRMPLTAVVGYAQLSLQGVRAGRTQDAVENLTTLAMVGKRMARLVDYLLTTESIGSEQLAWHAEFTDLDSLFERTRVTAQPMADGRQATIACDVGAVGLAEIDASRVNQILDNLVGNAVKAVPAGGHIQLTASQRGRDLVISIEDNGPGLAESTLARIRSRWNSFRIVGSGRQDVGRGTGFGLGLAIACRLTQLLGASLEIDVRPGSGTVIHLILRDAFTQADSGRIETKRLDRESGAPAEHFGQLVVGDGPLDATETALSLPDLDDQASEVA